jgi:diacylglycerol O-acyltransferase / wax synthase
MADTPGLNHRMTSLDASFLYLEQPNALLHVACVYTVGRTLDYERFVQHVEERLHLIPRYTQRAVMVPLNLGQPTWEPDPDFDIRAHMPRHRLKGHHDDAALADLCARLFAQPLERSRPLWEMHFIEYQHGCAVLAKTHHAMVDGASGVELINILMDPSPQAKLVPPPSKASQRTPQLPSPVVQLLEGVVDTLRLQAEIGFNVAKLLVRPSRALQEARETIEAVGALAGALSAPVPPTPFNGPIGRARALAWTRFSLNEVKAAKNRLGGTVNDVVLTVIAGGLRRYLRLRGMNPDRTELKAMVPVNVRGEHEHLKLGNRVSMMVAPLPIGIADPVERLRQVSVAMDVLKSSGQAGQMERVVALTDLLPPVLQRPLAWLQASIAPANTVCTNVPGPRETRYMLGEPVQLMVPLVPLAAGIGLGFAIMSYADQLTIGMNADADRVPDVWRLAEALRESFEELWVATGLERVATAAKVEPALTRRQRLHAGGGSAGGPMSQKPEDETPRSVG